MTLRILRDDEAHALVIRYEPDGARPPLLTPPSVARRALPEVAGARFTGVDMQECDCFCDHTQRCENGCSPEGADPQLEFSEWTCIGGTRYKLTDTRED